MIRLVLGMPLGQTREILERAVYGTFMQELEIIILFNLTFSIYQINMIYISVNVTKQSYFLWHYFFNTASWYISQFQILHNFKLPHSTLINFHPSVVLPTTWYVIFTTYLKLIIFFHTYTCFVKITYANITKE